VSRVPSNPLTLIGVEAVIDKDRCGSKLANELDADGFIILTDGGGIWQNYGKPDAREMKMASPEYLLGTKAGKNFPGSMGPKRGYFHCGVHHARIYSMECKGEPHRNSNVEY